MSIWHKEEDDLLLSFIHKDLGGSSESEARYSWRQIADSMTVHTAERNINQGIGRRVYSDYSVRQHYYQSLRPRMEREAEAQRVAAEAEAEERRVAEEAERAANTLPPIQEGWENQRPVVPLVSRFEPRPKGPPGSFQEYKDQENKRK